MMGEGAGPGGDDDEDDPVPDGRTYEGLISALGFAFASGLQDNLASLLILGNQLRLTTAMVGEVMQVVGLVEDWSRAGVNTGPVVDMVIGVGQQGGVMASTSCMVIILCGCSLLPTSVKSVSSALYTFLGNQLGVIFMMRGIQARQWVVVGCVFRMGVCGQVVPGEGSGVGSRVELISTKRGQLLSQTSNILGMQEGAMEV